MHGVFVVEIYDPQNQIHKTKFTKSNSQNQIHNTKFTKPNSQNQIHKNKFTKSNSQLRLLFPAMNMYVSVM